MDVVRSVPARSLGHHNLISRGLDPALCRLFIIDGAKALSKAIRQTFGRHTPIQRCQIHKARNIVERLLSHLHATVRRALRQAWEIEDVARAEHKSGTPPGARGAWRSWPNGSSAAPGGKRPDHSDRRCNEAL
jgi:hypothetical protein